MLYASPSEERPNRLTMNKLIRRPSPDLTTACATRKAITTSSTLVLAKPANAFEAEIVLVNTTAPAACIVEVSSGKTPSNTDTIADTNRANKCQAWAVSPAGTGENQIAVANAKGDARFSSKITLFLAAGGVCVLVAGAGLLMSAALP